MMKFSISDSHSWLQVQWIFDGSEKGILPSHGVAEAEASLKD
jgi:hypothetical protein